MLRSNHNINHKYQQSYIYLVYDIHQQKTYIRMFTVSTAHYSQKINVHHQQGQG